MFFFSETKGPIEGEFHVEAPGCGGALIFRYYKPQKISGDIKHPIKYLKFSQPKEISPFCTFNLRKYPKYIERTPKTSPILCWPPKISTKTSYPKNIHFSGNLKKKNKIQHFKQKRKIRADVYMKISEYPPPPPPPPGTEAQICPQVYGESYIKEI